MLWLHLLPVNGSIISFDLLNPNRKLHFIIIIQPTHTSFSFVMDNGGVERINHFNHTKYYYANPYLRSELNGDTYKEWK